MIILDIPNNPSIIVPSQQFNQLEIKNEELARAVADLTMTMAAMMGA